MVLKFQAFEYYICCLFLPLVQIFMYHFPWLNSSQKNHFHMVLNGAYRQFQETTLLA